MKMKFWSLPGSFPAATFQ